MIPVNVLRLVGAKRILFDLLYQKDVVGFRIRVGERGSSH